MGIAKAAKLRCRVTVSHDHPVNYVNEIHKMLDTIVISNPFYLIFKSDATFNGHSPDKAGRSEVGRRSVGGRSTSDRRSPTADRPPKITISHN